ncbi:ATP-binding cassette domain-containing protein [Pseudomonas neustonica]|uniref:ATP-binding cassette domain-containing protein n=1 Tax=Pseudomonas TaxID=286 RepID=UPI0015F6BB8F|nr:ATP-binding cassette domain-containing protein [Pseudomonas sp. 5Ae-yellow]MBA6421599.1 ATP-binding cassette domain-containing protein [Pseudomonas sp. 5Ae-yellow]|tara:strand:- start:203 stop:973 length:771 start_codon:yes stop_codon:yes gene_type:complete
MFQLESVSFAVPERTLLQPLDLVLSSGQMIGLIGHNGSGKSTLIKLLARQQAATAGRILLDERPLEAWGEREFARQVAYLPQQLPAAESLTVRELVGFGRYPWHGLLGRFSVDDQQEVERAMQLTDVTRFADSLVDTLSGGERQRVWLAMLLAQHTRYLLLDEPTSALDIAHQVEVLALVQRLSRELDLGVIVVLHDINMAARYCDHLVALHSGRLLLQGSPAELMNPEHLQAIYGLPMSVIPHPDQSSSIAVAHG